VDEFVQRVFLTEVALQCRLVQVGGDAVSVRVDACDIHVHVTRDIAGHLHRKVWRVWPVEADRWVTAR
jgi:hypothetical protein